MPEPVNALHRELRALDKVAACQRVHELVSQDRTLINDPGMRAWIRENAVLVSSLTGINLDDVVKGQPMADPEISELQYYAAARDHGWSYGDEDTPKEYCETDLPADEQAVLHVYPTDHWKAEYEWWKAKP